MTRFEKNVPSRLATTQTLGLGIPSFASLQAASRLLIPTRVSELSAKPPTPRTPGPVSQAEAEEQLAAIQRLQSLAYAISAAEGGLVRPKTVAELRDAEERQVLALALSAAEERTKSTFEGLDERVALAAALGAAEDRGRRRFLLLN